MRATNSLARWGLAACLVASTGLLQAQDTGFSKDFKIRLGYAPSSKDNLRGSYQGFGLNLAYGVGPGKIGAEFGYFYKTGDPYITTADGSMANGTITYTDGTTATAQGASTTQNLEDKRNELSGFCVRLSWQQKINETWDWQAGLQLGTQFKHQYVANVKSNGTATEGAAWQDTYQGVPREGGLNASPFVGVSWNVDKDSSFEFNLMFLGYKATEYHHYSGTGTYYKSGSQAGMNDPTVSFPYDKLEKNSRMVAHLEIAYVFHF